MSPFFGYVVGFRIHFIELIVFLNVNRVALQAVIILIFHCNPTLDDLNSALLITLLEGLMTNTTYSVFVHYGMGEGITPLTLFHQYRSARIVKCFFLGMVTWRAAGIMISFPSSRQMAMPQVESQSVLVRFTLTKRVSAGPVTNKTPVTRVPNVLRLDFGIN
jgi:hypothetical protein